MRTAWGCKARTCRAPLHNRDTGGFLDRIGSNHREVTGAQILGLFPAVAAAQVHRGDVQQSEVTAVRNVHVLSLFEGRLSFDDTVAQGYDDKELDSSKVSSPPWPSPGA